MAYTRADKFTETLKIPQSFSDLSNGFTKHPVSSELILVKNADSVRQAFKNMILTNVGERFFNPYFGSNVNNALFEPSGPFFIEDVKRYVFNSAKMFEPRVNILAVDVKSTDDVSYRIDITFSLINTTVPTTVTIYLKRAR